MGRKYTHQATRASLPPIPSPPEDVLVIIPVIGINVQLEEIKEAITDTVTIEGILKPVYNFKAGDDEKERWW